MSITVVGIDPSISGTAACSGLIGSSKYECVRFPSKFNGSHVSNRVKRYDGVIGRLMDHIEPLRPALALIEGYSHGSKNRTSELGEFGGILRWHLTDIAHVEEVTPCTMMKFLTGSGKQVKGQSKMRVAAAIWQQHKVSFDNDDMSDAYAYWLMAKAAFADPNTLKPHQLEALDTVFGARLNTVRALAQGVSDV